jgi:large subunit ribosomal protein L6
MSRIGKKPIIIPDNVEVRIEDNKIYVKGPKGELSKEINPDLKIEINEGKIFITPKSEKDADKSIEKGIKGKKVKAYWGLIRAIIFNMIKGVTEEYEKRLTIIGVGYKARVENDSLIINVGFSHPVVVKQPQKIKFIVDKDTIIVKGIDKEMVGQVAANIRKIRPPEVYKGKGIRYEGEVVRKKAGKKAVAAK